jgi:nitrite reductase/ring-hydroxylating ferredoxin subunit/uncharacterized membrane protein
MLLERIRRAVDKVETSEALDPVVDGALGAGRRLTGSSDAVKNLLSGTWLGHRLHPLMTDAVIGPWLSAWLLDLAGGRGSEKAADRLVAVGVAAYLPTAMAGMSDWSESTERSQHRSGLVHAAANTVGLGFQIASLVARARGNRRAAKVHSTVAMAAVGAGGWLGGHLSYALGVGVEHPTGDLGREWAATIPLDDLGDGRPVGVVVEGVDVVLVRRDGIVHALAATCRHAGGPLAEGALEDGCLTCPWHGSRFRLADGAVVRGPATTPQPCYETRLRDGRVEVRALG